LSQPGYQRKTVEGEPRLEELRRPDEVLLAFDVHDDLAFEHVERFVRVGMGVKGRHLALGHMILEAQERAVRLLGTGLPRVKATAEEPPLLAFTTASND